MKRLAALFLTGCAMTFGTTVQSASPTVTAAEWSAYSERFVAPDGRVIDDGNGGISHSEGQGYGLLLAYLAGNRPDFERIWSFTRTQLMLRDDGLAAWKWDPKAEPHVIDANNASDGDILIAYALSLAGESWDEPELTNGARRISEGLSRTSIFEINGRHLLSPGVAGFSAKDQPDGPIVNLSYWVLEAFPALARLVPDADWEKVARDGKDLMEEAAFSDRRLPPDWLSVREEPKAASGFPVEFGYNAIRIPLYLMRAASTDAELLKRLRDGMSGPRGGVVLVDLETGKTKEELMDPGYRIVRDLADCVLEGQGLPSEVKTFAPTLYYPSTLHLLALSHAREGYPQCL